MRLLDLSPVYIRHSLDDGRECHAEVNALTEAQGLRFLCPVCFVANSGRVGTHSVVCWSTSRGAPDTAVPGPGRWRIEGTHMDDITLEAEPGKSRSILLLGGCGAHFFITRGEVHP